MSNHASQPAPIAPLYARRTPSGLDGRGQSQGAVVSRPGLETRAARALTEAIAGNKVRQLTVYDRHVAVSLHVRHGQLVAAVADDDLKLLIRRLLADGFLDAPAASALLGGPNALARLVAQIPDEILTTVLRNRFEDNLARFLASESSPVVGAMPMITYNPQRCPDLGELLWRCASVAENAMRLDPRETLARGLVPPITPEQRRIVSLAFPTIDVGELVRKLGAEPMAGRARLWNLVQRGVLERVVKPHATPMPVRPTRTSTLAD